MRTSILLALTVLAFPVFAQSTFDLTGYVAARSVHATGPESWLEGGFGRFEEGGDRRQFFGVAQVGADWRPSRYFDVHVSGLARRDPGDSKTDAGAVEAYADVRAIFGFDELQLRAGQFFLPTSRENKDALWASPYTINFSAINSWIGEEVRPIGLDLQWRHTTRFGHVITTAATAFRGNDTMGTLLAWRGWPIGNYLTTYNDVEPLPPIDSLDTFFFRQREDGTKPFGSDLDGRTGYSGRIRYSVPPNGTIQYTYLDNRGDRLIYQGEYAWRTKFHHIGAELGDPDRGVLAAEYIRGSTGMGIFAAFVQADFHAAYILMSAKRNHTRLSLRYDLFDVSERDFSPAESNDDHGHAWTLSWMYDLGRNLRLAAEATQLHGTHPFAPNPSGRSTTVELRYRF